MPDTTPPTLIHYNPDTFSTAPAACGDTLGWITRHAGKVTCFACRKSALFKAAQQSDKVDADLEKLGVETPTPPKVIDRATFDSWKNERGMFVIEEVIHHGDYRSARRVEVYAINPITVDAILQSSAYCYDSWLHPENPEHKEPRNTKLHELVSDLRNGRTNRSIGWSTFRTITEH